MLTNLGKLPIERIQSMLKFAPGYDRTLEQLATFLEAAQRELLEARATYHVRQNVVDDVLQADPVLKAVHTGSNATPAERYGPSHFI